MNRRGFLGLLATAPVAAALSPDLVELLTPKRSIFLPPRGGWVPLQRYTHQTYALGFAITEDTADVCGGIMMPAQLRKQLAAGLNQVFREEYSKQSSDWKNLFR